MRIRLLVYNIHKCIGGVDRKYRPDRIRDVIEAHEPDLVFLQEADEGAERTGRHLQADLLGDMLGFRHRIFYPNVRVRGGGHYGNAILSRFPLTESRNIDLSLPLSKRRSVLYARARIRSGGRGAPRTAHLYNLHLGLSQLLRKLQLRRFLESRPFADCHPRTPILLAGDFNDVWGTLGESFLAPKGFRGMKRPIRTFPAVAPVRALDCLYVRGDAELKDVRRSDLGLARWASDHRPLIADIDLR